MTVVEEKGPISGIGLWLGTLVVFLLLISGFWWHQVKTSGPLTTSVPKATPPAKKFNLQVSFSNLQPLKKGHFEIWAKIEEKMTSLGKFRIDKEGKILELEGDKIISEFTSTKDLSKTKEILVTIEPEGDRDASPSGVFLLQGKIYGDKGDISFQAVNLKNASGQYFLGTPSYSKDDNLPSGIWFAKPAGKDYSHQKASLILPDAPSGFTYEGWVIHRGEYLSIGRFKTPVGDDDFSQHSGLKRYPDYPGEDFLINEPEGVEFEFPLELNNGESRVIISLEPELQGKDPTGKEPFQIQFLKGTIPRGAKTYTLYNLQLDLSVLPKGRVEIR